MRTNARIQIDDWLKSIRFDVDSVIDVGGIALPVRKVLENCTFKTYKILDEEAEDKGMKTDYVYDLNYPIKLDMKFDIAFYMSVSNFVFDPMTATRNINGFLKMNGLLYASYLFTFPQNKSFDCLRYTARGAEKILKECGFKILEIKPIIAADEKLLNKFCEQESWFLRKTNHIGYLMKAQKISEKIQ